MSGFSTAADARSVLYLLAAYNDREVIDVVVKARKAGTKAGVTGGQIHVEFIVEGDFGARRGWGGIGGWKCAALREARGRVAARRRLCCGHEYCCCC